MNTDTALPGPSLPKFRRVTGYGVAIVLAPYLLLKIAWCLGLFLPAEHMGEAGWRVINAATVVLAAAAILLAMALCRPWGQKLPAPLVVLPLWVGTGLLVPALLLAPALGPAAMARDQAAGAADIWAWEQLLVMLCLVGAGIGLPLCMAGYAKARWPEALGGPLVHPRLPGNTRQLQIPLAGFAAAGCVLLGITKVYWSMGGTVGIAPALLAERDVWWHLFSFSTGAWALAGAWGLLVLATHRGSRRFLPPMAAAWVASAVLFAQNLFAGLSATRAGSMPSPEHPVARVLAGEAGIVLGVLMVMCILLVLHDRRRACGATAR